MNPRRRIEHIQGVFSFLSLLLSFYPHFITPSPPLLSLSVDDDLCKVWTETVTGAM